MRGGEFQKMGVSRTKESIQKTTKNMGKTTGKTTQNPENRAKATVYIYICCLTRFSGVISSFSGRKMEDHSWQETTDYDQF